MRTALAVVLWTSLGLIVYTHVGYPLLLWLLARARDDAHLLAELQVHGGASSPLRRRRAAILVTCAHTPAT